jgi:hypothetical protein
MILGCPQRQGSVRVTINSPVGVNLFNTVVNAYNSAWIALR